MDSGLGRRWRLFHNFYFANILIHMVWIGSTFHGLNQLLMFLLHPWRSFPAPLQWCWTSWKFLPFGSPILDLWSSAGVITGFLVWSLQRTLLLRSVWSDSQPQNGPGLFQTSSTPDWWRSLSSWGPSEQQKWFWSHLQFCSSTQFLKHLHFVEDLHAIC